MVALAILLVLIGSIVYAYIVSRSQVEVLANFTSGFLFLIFSVGLLFSAYLKIAPIHFFLILLQVLGVGLLLLYFLKKKMGFGNFRLEIKDFGMELVALSLLLAFSVFCLFSVHYNYTGISSDLVHPEYLVKGQSYAYPYFVDEWYSIAFSQFTIEKWLPPVFNPVSAESVPFVNIQWLFHNLNSAVFYLFQLDPVLFYVPLGISVNVLIIVVSYFILRLSRVEILPALLTSALMLTITHGSNLPTFWSYLPINLVLLTFLLAVLNNIKQNYFLFSFYSLLSLVIYPPIIVFILPLFLHKKVLTKRLALIVGLAFVVLLTSLLIVIQSQQGIAESLKYIFSRLWFTKHSPAIEDVFSPFSVLPYLVFLTLAIGIYAKKNICSYLLGIVFDNSWLLVGI